jgi:hypothetical protein
MVDRREIITICRQIGNMMEAGVDILRITQVLRAQTDNARLLQIYDHFDHDLRMGASIAEAMARASDIFSPFMVSLVRQAEQRSDLESISAHVAQAFLKIADFLQQDLQQDDEPPAALPPQLDISAVPDTAATWPLTLRAIENFTDKLQLIALRALTLLAGLLLTLAAVWASFEMGWIERRWLNVTLCCVTALFIGGAGVWVRRQIEAEKRLAEKCSFCGAPQRDDAPLRGIPGFPGAAICARCADVLAQRSENLLPANAVPVAANTAKTSAPAASAAPRPVPKPAPSNGGTPASRTVRVSPAFDEADYE